MPEALRPDGRVLQVNVSAGGVPKRPVPEAHVGRLGLAGDRHREATIHGGPHRAVCLFAIEAIERVAAEGHPIEPGSAGENLTTAGVELSLLPVGTRLAIGDEIVLELSWATMPCDTIAASFRDGESGRISVLRHPADSRMYARVLREGRVRPGDPIRVMPPAAESAAATHVLLNRVETIERFSDVRLWEAARAAGYPVEILDDGDLHAGASAVLEGWAFNRAGGLRILPGDLGRVRGHFERARASGWIPFETQPWPGARPDCAMVVHALEPDADAAGSRGAAGPGGRVGPAARPAVAVSEARDEHARAAAAAVFGRLHARSPALADAWQAVLGRLAGTVGHHAVVARIDGQPVGVGLLVTRGRTGLIRGATVVPEARGRGVHRALVGERLAIARGLGVDLVAATPFADDRAAAASLARAGFRAIWRRDYYAFDPGASPGSGGGGRD